MAPSATEQAFSGWPRAMYEFFDGLIEDNSKAYFQAHKADYEQHVRAPMERLLAACEAEFGPGHIFRPYRDVRFSKDKRPYKEAMGATAGGHGGPVHYVQIDGSGIMAASGYYMMAPDQVARYRLAVADAAAGEAIAALVASLRAARYEVGSVDLQRVPRPYPADHPRADLLRHKSLIVSKRWEQPGWLQSKRALTEVVKVWRAAGPLNVWLDAQVGPSTAPAEPGRPSGR